jgi:transcriptional regulator with XRE-family HTH domain
MTVQIKQITERIKEIREISGITAETLASKLGVTKDLYINYESGNTDIPVGIIFKIAEMFNIELSVMLGGDNPKLHIYGVVRNGQGLKLERKKQHAWLHCPYYWNCKSKNCIDSSCEIVKLISQDKPHLQYLSLHSIKSSGYHKIGMSKRERSYLVYI